MKNYKNTNYSISEDGIVLNTKTNRKLKPVNTKGGYQQVVIIINNKRKRLYIHRMVAETYIPIPKELQGNTKLEVDHINRIRQDNRVTNLRWVTSRMNNQNRVDNTPVLQYTNNLTLVKKYKGVRDAERRTGIGASHITAVCKQKRKTAGGYIWKYA